MIQLNANKFATICCLVIAVSLQAKADTSYTPAPVSGGPYPASGVPASEAGTSSASVPYQAAGWKPAGRLLVLPLKSTEAVSSTKKCATPGKTTTASITESEFVSEESTATSPKPEPESENINESVNAHQQIPVVPDSGIYYVLLPDGRLQKVTYSTMPLVQTVAKLKNNNAVAENEVPSGYSANVKYQDVEPVRGPIYAYSAAPLIRIFK